MTKELLENLTQLFAQEPTSEQWDAIVTLVSSVEITAGDPVCEFMIQSLRNWRTQTASTQTTTETPFGLWQLTSASKSSGDSAFDVVQGYYFEDAYNTVQEFCAALLECTDDEPIHHWTDESQLSGLLLELAPGKFREHQLWEPLPLSNHTMIRQLDAPPYDIVASTEDEYQKRLEFTEYSGFTYSDLPAHSDKGWLKMDGEPETSTRICSLIKGGNRDSLELQDFLTYSDGQLNRTIFHVWDSIYISVYQQTYQLILTRS